MIRQGEVTQDYFEIKRLYYLSKARDHKAVPTWNYQVVHMRGKF
ncbi:FMN-binding negative transcriptional regulator [Avibacterium paragallinarum]